MKICGTQSALERTIRDALAREGCVALAAGVRLGLQFPPFAEATWQLCTALPLTPREQAALAAAEAEVCSRYDLGFLPELDVDDDAASDAENWLSAARRSC